MIDNKGSIKVIDFMNLCRGPKEYDIARTFYLIGYSKLPKEITNANKLQAMREKFANDYLKEMSMDIQDIKPYLSIIEKCHAIETSH